MREILVLSIVIILLCIPGVTGLSVSSASVNPSGDLEDGTPVTVTCDIPRTGILIYDQLVITTDLDDPAWDPVVIVRNRETPVIPASANGNTLILNGAVYNHPTSVPVKVRVSVNGTVPYNHTTDQWLLDIRHLDADGTMYAYPSGNYSIPMPGSPKAAVPGITEVPAVPDTIPVPEEPVMTTPAPVPADTAPATTVTATKNTVTLPTPLPATSPAAAIPAEPLGIFCAVVVAASIVQNISGR